MIVEELKKHKKDAVVSCISLLMMDRGREQVDKLLVAAGAHASCPEHDALVPTRDAAHDADGAEQHPPLGRSGCTRRSRGSRPVPPPDRPFLSTKPYREYVSSYR